MRDPHALVAALSRDRVSLELSTLDVCFLAGLHLRADRDALASFGDEHLCDLFEQVCDMVEPGAENPRKRATHAIQRLRDQRLLARVDAAGLARAGEYTLTRLAASIVEFYLADDALTRESLTLLTKTLLGQLAEVRSAAQRARSDDDWIQQVTGPLRITVGDLVGGIERRQRGLDAAQEEVQREIANLLGADWFQAVDEAQALLDKTTDTLAELNEVLLRDTHQFVALLHEIQDLAERAAAPQGVEAAAASQRVIEHVDRIAVWGDARQRAWSEYYQYVHAYLRDVVRLDADRALSQRLRDQLGSWPEAPFTLVVARAPSIRLLRDMSPRVERPAVLRSRAERDRAPEAVPVDTGAPELEALLERALAEGARSLSTVSARVLAELRPGERFLAAGRVAALLPRVARVRSEREQAWVRVGDGLEPRLEVEEWEVEPTSPNAASAGGEA